MHGSSGGKIPACFYRLVDNLTDLRGAPTEIEALTMDIKPAIDVDTTWVVPLFLFPGKHVCNDVPKIINRLNHQGVKTQALPFLGSWPVWLSLLMDFVNRESTYNSLALLHHPINTDLGRHYLTYLKYLLKIPIITWDNGRDVVEQNYSHYSLVPYSLAPNRNLQDLSTFQGLTSLLEIDSFQLALLDFLSLLP